MAAPSFPFVEAVFEDSADASIGVVNIRSTWRAQADRSDAETLTEKIVMVNQKNQAIKRVDVQVATDAELAPMARASESAQNAALERFLLARTNQTVAALRQNARSVALDGYDPASIHDSAEPVSCVHSLKHLGGPAASAPESVTAVAWNCTGAIVAAAYGLLESADAQSWAARKSMLCAWSVTRRSLNPSKADVVVELADSVACLAFHPEEPTLLAGGSFNGDVLLWDVSADEEPLQFKSTLSDYTHHEPVSQLSWVRRLGVAAQGSEPNAYQLVSLGADGRVLVWRPLEEAHRLLHPVAGFTLLAPPAAAVSKSSASASASSALRGPGASEKSLRVHGGTALCCSSEDPTAFVAGVESGLLLKCSLSAGRQRQPESVATAGNDLTWSKDAAALLSRVGYNDYQKVKLKIEKAAILARETEVGLSTVFGANVSAAALFPSPVAFAFEAHTGPVYGLAHSRFHRNLFASASTDSTLRVHSLLQAAPLLSLSPTSGTVFCVAWSASRPMVLAAGCADGRIYVYDLSLLVSPGGGGGGGGSAQLQPAEVLQASAKPIFALQFNERTPELVASGDGDGCVKVWKLGKRLSQMQIRERDRLEAFVARYSAAEEEETGALAEGDDAQGVAVAPVAVARATAAAAGASVSDGEED